MLDRLKNVMKGMLNKGLEKVETPEMLAEQAQMELEKNVKTLKESLISGMTNEKMLEQQMQKASKEVEGWKKKATLAVHQGNDELARECLRKREEQVQQEESLKHQLAEQKKSNAALKDRHKELEKELRDFQLKKKDLIARAQMSQTSAKASELLSGAGGNSSLDKIEAKIRQKEMENEALESLREKPLEDQFKELDATADIDLELLALKEQIAQPKLIEDSKSKKEAEAQHEAADDDAITVDVEEIKPGEE